MRIKYKQSIKAQVDEAIANNSNDSIDYISFSKDEYIQFLEEIGPIGSIILTDSFTKHKSYRKIRIKVLE